MAAFSDSDIKALLGEPKVLPEDYLVRLRLRPKRGHSEASLELIGRHDNEFVLYLRQSDLNALDFSVILAVRPRASGRLFRLRRYNGRSHFHTNRIERETFYDFHVHTATERYQDFGGKEDEFAVRTDRYGDANGALECAIEDCGFIRPASAQQTLL